MKQDGVGLNVASGKLRFTAYINDRYRYATRSTAIETGVKYHIAGTYDGTYLRLYLNGVLQVSTKIVGTIANPDPVGGNPTVMAIGANPSGAGAGYGYAHMNVYNAKIHDRALTADEISAKVNGQGSGYVANNDSVTVTFTFNEEVYGFDADDITVINGTKGTFTKISDSLYTLQITDIPAETTLQIKIAEESYTDDIGNWGISSTMVVRTRDTIGPSVTITSDLENPDVSTNTETIIYTFKFNEPIIGFTASDVTVTKGTKGTFTKVSNTEYTLEVTNTDKGTYWQKVSLAAGKTNDDAGNLNTAGSISIAIDRTGPTVTATPAKTETDSIKKQETVTLKVEDKGANAEQTSMQSGLSDSNVYQYYLSASATALEPAYSGHDWTTFTNGGKVTLGTGLTGTYYLFVKTVSDNLGNISETKGTMVEIDGVTYHMFGEYIFDNTAGTLGSLIMKLDNSSGVDYTNATWTKHDVYLKKVDGSDELSGHKETYFDIVKDGSSYLSKQTETTLTETGTYTITVTTVDNAENVVSKELYTVKIDQTNPTVGTLTMKLESSSGSAYESDTWTNKDVYIAKVDGTDNQSGHLQTTYTVTKDGKAFLTDQTEAYTLTDQGEYVITVTTEDKAGEAYSEEGNKSTSETYTVKIDKTKPTATMTTSATGIIDANTTTTNEPTVTIYVSDLEDTGGSGIDENRTKVEAFFKVWFTGGYGGTSHYLNKEFVYDEENDRYYTTFTFSELKDPETGNTNNGDGSYRFDLYVHDVAGNQTILIKWVHYDTTAPTPGTLDMKLGSSSGSDYENDTWTNEDVYIAKVDGTDELSGHQSTTYTVEVKQADGTYVTYNDLVDQIAATTITDQGEYRITVTTTDKAGNVASGEPYIVKIDKTKPTGKLSSSETITNKLTVDIYVYPSDLKDTGGSGINYETKTMIAAFYKEWASGAYGATTRRIQDWEYDEENERYVIPYTFSEIQDPSTGLTNNGDGTYCFELHLYDVAGNVNYIGISPKVIYDTTLPIPGTITMTTTLDSGEEVTYTSDTWTKHDVVLSDVINGSDALSGHKSTTYTIEKKKADGTYATYNNLSNQTEGTTLTETGEYKITVTTTDKATNVATNSYIVKIDKEAPTVGSLTAKLDDSTGEAYTYDTWTKHSVYISVVNGSDNESGHLKTTYTVTKDGQKYLTDQTEAYTLTNDGEYKIVVTTEDAAGKSYSENGNIVTSETYTIKIDKHNPSAIITGEATVVQDGLIRYYNAVNNTGNGHSNSTTTWTDLSGNHDGTVKGAIFDQQYLLYEDDTNYVSIGEVSMTAAFTIEVSLKLNEIQSGTVYIIDNIQFAGIALRLVDGKPQIMAHIGGGYKYLTFNEVLDINRLYNLTAIYDGSKLKMYVDGVLQVETPCSGTIKHPEGTHMVIGGDATPGGTTGIIPRMKLYSARVYEKALTESEIKQNFNADRIIQAKKQNAGLIRYYDGYNNTGTGHNNSATKWKDLTENYDARLSDTVTFEDDSLLLNEETDYVLLGEMTMTDEFTFDISFKLNQTEYSGRVYILSNLEFAGMGIYIEDNKLELSAHIGGTYRYITYDEQLETDKVYNMTATYNGSSFALYVDGEFYAETQCSGVIKQPANGVQMVIGGDATKNGGVVGLKPKCNVYHVKIYDIALTEKEIANIQTETDSFVANNDSVTLTFRFDENVYGFDASDITITNGTKGTFTKVSDSEYTLEVTGIVAEKILKVEIAEDSYVDRAGNYGDLPVVERTRDTKGPSVTITADPPNNPTNAESITYTFSFNEPTVGFTIDDVQVSNGTKGTFTKISSTQFTLVVTNDADGTSIQTITVPAGVTNDDAGNLNTEISKSVTIERTAPTITATPDKTTNEASEDGRAVTSQVITLTAADIGKNDEETALQSGLSDSNVYEYYLSKDATKLVPFKEGATWTTFTSGTSFTIGENLTGTYYLFVKTITDNLGNVSDKTGKMVEIDGVTYHMFGEYVFDNTEPTMVVEPTETTSELSADGKAVLLQGVRITLSDLGTAGLHPENTYEYYVSSSEDELVGGQWKTYENVVAFTIGQNLTGNYYLFVKAIQDGAGNESAVEGTIKTIDDTKCHVFGIYVFDNSMPKIEIISNGNETYQKEQSTVITVEEVGTAGLDEGNEEEELESTIKYSWVQGTKELIESDLVQNGTVFTSGDTITKNDGTGDNFYLWVMAKDKLGNINITKSEPYYLDNTKPTIGEEVLLVPTSETTYRLTVYDLLDITGTIKQSGLRGYYISKDPTQPTESSAWAQTETSTIITDKWIPQVDSTVTLENVDEQSIYYMWTIDNAGNISDAKEIDTNSINYSINDEEWFETFVEAVAAAEAGETIKVLKDVRDETNGTVDKNIILDTNGKTLTKNASSITVNEGCTLEIIGSGTITTETLTDIITVHGNLKSKQATLRGSDKRIIVNRGAGSIDINSGNIYGNIFAGSGVVNLNSGNIYGNIYGGNPYAEVETSNIILNGTTVQGNIYGGDGTKQVGTSNITLKEGTVKGRVFGGMNVETANITLDGAAIEEDIYGGGNVVGTVTNANINIKSGSVTNVYGGALQGGTVTNANITIHDSANISRNVYGGGNNSSVGTSESNGKVVINIAGGTIGKSLYGGSFNGMVYGDITINIGADTIENTELISSNITIKENIYGGGNNEGISENYTQQIVTGTSTINVDANGYASFKLGQNIFGSGLYGTVNDSSITIKNLGTTAQPYVLQSIQRTGNLIIDNSNLEILGIADENNSNIETAFTLNKIKNLKVKNGTTLHLRRGFNQVEELNSLVDVNGTETKAAVTIKDGEITNSNVTNRIYVYEGVNLIIAKEEYKQNVQLSKFGKVNGMTFFGMYAHDRSTDAIKYDLYDPETPTSASLFGLGSYVEGIYDSSGATTVDGFYTNTVNETDSSIEQQYIDVITYASTYQDWVLGEKTYTQEVTMIAQRNRERVHVEVPLDYFVKAGNEYNISLFSINSLEKGISLVDKSQIKTMASTTSEANNKFALTMTNGSEGWKTAGETNFYTSTTTPIKGTTQYISDDSGKVPYFDLYLYNSINITETKDCGLVSMVFLVKQTVEGDPTAGGTFRVAVTVNIQTLNNEEDLTIFDTESHITAGKNYELFIENETNITDRSSMTFYVNTYPVGKYNTSDYRVLSTTCELPLNTEITMLDYAQGNSPIVYYYVIEDGYDALEDGKYIYKLSNFKLMGATSNYANPNSTYASIGYEEFRFIFDFKDAEIEDNILEKTISLEIRDGLENEPKNNQLTENTFNIYKGKNSNLTLSVGKPSTNIYEIINDTELTFNVTSNIQRQYVGAKVIHDTYYYEKKPGISISIYDSNNNRLSYEKLQGIYFTIGGEDYYPDSTGRVRICLADNIAKITKTIKANIGKGILAAGEYKIRIENFASDNGTYYGLTGENLNDTTIKVMDLERGLQVSIAETDRVIDAPTGKTYEGDNVIDIDVKASDITENTNIRMTLYRRNITFNEDLTYAGISYTQVDLQDYVSTTLTKPGDKGLVQSKTYEYLITNEVEEQTLIELALNLEDSLPTGGYKLVFELYGENTCMGTTEQHFVITDLVNVD